MNGNLASLVLASLVLARSRKTADLALACFGQFSCQNVEYVD